MWGTILLIALLITAIIAMYLLGQQKNTASQQQIAMLQKQVDDASAVLSQNKELLDANYRSILRTVNDILQKNTATYDATSATYGTINSKNTKALELTSQIIQTKAESFVSQ